MDSPELPEDPRHVEWLDHEIKNVYELKERLNKILDLIAGYLDHVAETIEKIPSREEIVCLMQDVIANRTEGHAEYVIEKVSKFLEPLIEDFVELEDRVGKIEKSSVSCTPIEIDPQNIGGITCRRFEPGEVDVLRQSIQDQINTGTFKIEDRVSKGDRSVVRSYLVTTKEDK